MICQTLSNIQTYSALLHITCSLCGHPGKYGKPTQVWQSAQVISLWRTPEHEWFIKLTQLATNRNRGHNQGICSSLRERAAGVCALTLLHSPVCVIQRRTHMAEGWTIQEKILMSNPRSTPWTLLMGHEKQYSSSPKGTSGLVRNCCGTMESQGKPLEGKDKIWSGSTVDVVLSAGLMLMLLQQPWNLCEGFSSHRIYFHLFLYLLFIIVFYHLC